MMNVISSLKRNIVPEIQKEALLLQHPSGQQSRWRGRFGNEILTAEKNYCQDVTYSQ